MNIRTGMLVIITVVCVQIGFTGIFTLTNLQKMHDMTHDIEDSHLPELMILKDMKMDIMESTSFTIEYLFTGDESEEQEEKEKIAEEKSKFYADYAIYAAKVAHDPLEATRAEELGKRATLVFNQAYKIISTKKENMTTSSISAIENDFNDSKKDFLNLINVYIEFEQGELQEKNEDLLKTHDDVWNFTLVMVISTIIFTSASGMFFSRSVAGKLDDLMLQVKKLRKDET